MSLIDALLRTWQLVSTSWIEQPNIFFAERILQEMLVVEVILYKELLGFPSYGHLRLQIASVCMFSCWTYLLQATRSQILTHKMVLVAKRKYFTTQWKLNFSLSEFSSMKFSVLKQNFDNSRSMILRSPRNQASPGKYAARYYGSFPSQNKDGSSSAIQRCFWNQRNSLNSRSGDKTFWWSIRIYQQSVRNVLGWGILPKNSTLYRSFRGKFCSWRGSHAHSVKNRTTIDRERWDFSIWLNLFVNVSISSTGREP